MTEPQERFFGSQAKYPLFCGGFGTGKTEALILCAVRDALASSSALIGLYEPTYDLVRLILAPRIEERLLELGIRHRHNKQENIVYTSNGRCGDFILRTLDNPARIVGYETYRAHVDELDTLRESHAADAWRKIIARNRQQPEGIANPINRVSAYTTPEGFKFAYKTWGKDPAPGYEMVQASTRTNPFLPPDYVDGLRSSYPSQLIDAYINGEFVNLTSGAVYPDFSRAANGCDAVPMPNEPLHVGVDFNVHNCTAVIGVIRDDCPLIVGEITGVRDTPAMCEAIREMYPSNHVTVYPDASGARSQSTNAAESDLRILQAAGFSVRAPSRNPAIRDRVAAVNALILRGDGARRLAVNTVRCPKVTESLEQQIFDGNGMPDKSSGKDHANDALGYFLHYHWPISKPSRDNLSVIHIGR